EWCANVGIGPLVSAAIGTPALCLLFWPSVDRVSDISVSEATDIVTPSRPNAAIHTALPKGFRESRGVRALPGVPKACSLCSAGWGTGQESRSKENNHGASDIEGDGEPPPAARDRSANPERSPGPQCTARRYAAAAQAAGASPAG